MSRIGGWWVASHDALAGEHVVSSYYVNYLRPDERPLGGKLYLTNKRLLFSPHFLDSIFGGEKTTIDIQTVEDVLRQPFHENNETESTGAKSDKVDKLTLELSDGTTRSFVVSDLEKALREISDAVSNPGNGTQTGS